MQKGYLPLLTLLSVFPQGQNIAGGRAENFHLNGHCSFLQAVIHMSLYFDDKVKHAARVALFQLKNVQFRKFLLSSGMTVLIFATTLDQAKFKKNYNLQI